MYVNRPRRRKVELMIQYNTHQTPMLFRRTAGKRVYLGNALLLLKDSRQVPDFDPAMPRRWFSLGSVMWASGIVYKTGPSGRKRKLGWQGHTASGERIGTRRRPAQG